MHTQLGLQGMQYSVTAGSIGYWVGMFHVVTWPVGQPHTGGSAPLLDEDALLDEEVLVDEVLVDDEALVEEDDAPLVPVPDEALVVDEDDPPVPLLDVVLVDDDPPAGPDELVWPPVPDAPLLDAGDEVVVAPPPPPVPQPPPPVHAASTKPPAAIAVQTVTRLPPVAIRTCLKLASGSRPSDVSCRSR